MKKYKFPIILIMINFIPFHAYADGQGVPINYDNLSFFEEPLATEIGPATMGINLLFDQSAQYNSTNEEDTYNTRIIGDVRIETQLPNSAQLAVNYIGNYNRLADNEEEEEYTDDFAVSLSDEWGTLAGGNVTGSVREKTRRKRGFGNANLENDDFIGELDEAGGFYAVRYNAYELSVTADQEGRAETGIAFQKPIGTANYFASARLRKGDTTESFATDDVGETYGGAVVGQYTYASFLIDAQAGYELVDLDNADSNNEHLFGSIGTQYKYGAYRVSAEAGLGRYDGQDRRALAIGSQLDIARGASVNLGINYVFENKDEDINAISSIRYEL